jgi:hypothetical protein
MLRVLPIHKARTSLNRFGSKHASLTRRRPSDSEASLPRRPTEEIVLETP